MATLKVGDPVILVVPTNPVLHGKPATVRLLEEWGAHVLCPAAATGHYRAGWEEMALLTEANGKYLPDGPPAPPENAKLAGRQPRDAGYTGDLCGGCGGCRMRRNGACLLCDDCGASSGCS